MPRALPRPLRMRRVRSRDPATRAAARGGIASAATVASSTPADRPRQPACAAPTRVPVGAREKYRQAIGRENHAGTAARLCPRSQHPRPDDSPAVGDRRDVGAVHLLEPGGLRFEPELPAQAAAVLDHAIRLVAHVLREIERVVGRAADAATAQGRHAHARPRERAIQGTMTRSCASACRARIRAQDLEQRFHVRAAAAPATPTSAADCGCTSARRAACSAWRGNSRSASTSSALAPLRQQQAPAIRRIADDRCRYARSARGSGACARFRA